VFFSEAQRVSEKEISLRPEESKCDTEKDKEMELCRVCSYDVCVCVCWAKLEIIRLIFST